MTDFSRIRYHSVIEFLTLENVQPRMQPNDLYTVKMANWRGSAKLIKTFTCRVVHCGPQNLFATSASSLCKPVPAQRRVFTIFGAFDRLDSSTTTRHCDYWSRHSLPRAWTIVLDYLRTAVWLRKRMQRV